MRAAARGRRAWRPRLSPIAYRLSPIAYRLSPIAYRLSPIAYRGARGGAGSMYELVVGIPSGATAGRLPRFDD
jgi:hypothetical protein